MHKLKNVSSTNSYATCDTPHPLQTNQPSLLHLGKHFTRSSNLTLPTPTPAFPPCHCLPHPPQHLRLPLPLHRPKRVLLRPPPSARERPQQRGGPERGPPRVHPGHRGAAHPEHGPPSQPCGSAQPLLAAGGCIVSAGWDGDGRKCGRVLASRGRGGRWGL